VMKKEELKGITCVKNVNILEQLLNSVNYVVVLCQLKLKC